MKKVLLLLAVMLGGLGSVSATETVLLSEQTTLSDWGATSAMKATSSQVAVGDFIKIVVSTIPDGSQLLLKKASDWSDICVGNGLLYATTYYQVTSDIYTELTGSGILLQGNGGVVVDKVSIVPASDFDVMTLYNGGGTIAEAWGNITVSCANFNAAKAGDILVFNTTSETSGKENFCFKQDWTDALSCYHLIKPWCVALTSDLISGYYATDNHIQAGVAGITVNSVQIYRLKENTPSVETTLSPNDALPTAFGNWANSVIVPAAQFVNVKAGDEIRIGLTDADIETSYNAQVYIKTGDTDWPLIADKGYNVPYIPELVFAVTADVATKLKATGLILQGKNVTVSSLKLYRSEVDVAFPAGKDYVSFCSSSALDFTGIDGLTAYVVSEVGATSATLTEVTQVPAGTGLILKGTAGTTYQVPVIATADAIATNYLKAAINDVAVEANSTYVLSDGQFKTFTGTTIPAGKAYIAKGAGARDLDLNFGGETTGINEELRMKNEESVYYNIAGQRVAQPTKGLYIVNGKKVIIK